MCAQISLQKMKPIEKLGPNNELGKSYNTLVIWGPDLEFHPDLRKQFLKLNNEQGSKEDNEEKQIRQGQEFIQFIQYK